MSRWISTVLSVGLCVSGCAAEDSGGGVPVAIQPDGGDGFTGCSTDLNLDPGSAVEITAGEPESEYICTPRDTDYYGFTVAAATPLIELSLSNQAPLTPVLYQVSLMNEAGRMLFTDSDPGRGRQPVRIDAVHLVPDPGTYYLVVRDASGLGVDRQNPYSLSLTLLPDPDANEPNDDTTNAGPLVDCTHGFLSHAADEDWFRVDLPPSKLLHVRLQADGGDEAPIRPRYEIFPARSDEAVSGGSAEGVHCLPGGVSYFLRVLDSRGESSLDSGYELCTGFVEEDDPNEGEERNDGPATATISLGTFGEVSDGRIGCIGDRDWYRVGVLEGTALDTPSLYDVEVNLSQEPEGELSVAFSLIRPHPGTPCAIDADCALIRVACTDGAQCPSRICNTPKRQCQGSGVCLEEGVCGLTVYTSNLKRTAEEPTRLSSRQPIFEGGRHYLVIHDFQDDDYDREIRYSVQWRALEEPDRNEPNGNYHPYLGSGRGSNRGAAATATRQNVNVTRDPVTGEPYALEWDCMEGFISYAGDEDWFQLPIPEDVDTPPAVLGFEFNYTDNESPLKLNYTMYAGNVDNPHLGWSEGENHPDVGVEIPAAGIWGEAECAYACCNAPRPFWLRISEGGERTGFSTEHRYSVCMTATPGCQHLICPCGFFCGPGTCQGVGSVPPEPEEREAEGEGEGSGD